MRSYTNLTYLFWYLVIQSFLKKATVVPEELDQLDLLLEGLGIEEDINVEDFDPVELEEDENNNN